MQSTDLNGIRRVLLFGWLVTAVAIAAVPILLTDSQTRSDYYWFRIGWVELLAALTWGYFLWFLKSADNPTTSQNRAGGGNAAVGIVVVVYSVTSCLAMLFHAFLPLSKEGDRTHMATQLTLLAVAAVVCALLQIAKQLQANGKSSSEKSEEKQGQG